MAGGVFDPAKPDPDQDQEKEMKRKEKKGGKRGGGEEKEKEKELEKVTCIFTTCYFSSLYPILDLQSSLVLPAPD